MLEALLEESPLLHGADHDLVNWQLQAPVLRWLDSQLHEGQTTLETGCGYSTIVFAHSRARHMTISPAEIEHARIVEWCNTHGVSTGSLTFVAALSQDVLPGMAMESLDLVLIDGDHAFPLPLIDWYYTARALRSGGLMVLDDIQIRTVALLREFLQNEQGRWSEVERIGTTAVFEKLTDAAVEPIPWSCQPFGAPAPTTTSVIVRFGRRLRRLSARIRR